MIVPQMKSLKLGEGNLHIFPKIRKRNESTEFNKLYINGLKAIYGLSDELNTPLFGGSSRKFLRASLCLQDGSNRLIFNGLKAKYAMQ